jgi:hypothetical protein
MDLVYIQCYVEKINDLWYIMYPDCTKADYHGYRNRGSAQRMLNYFIKEEKKKNE